VASALFGMPCGPFPAGLFVRTGDRVCRASSFRSPAHETRCASKSRYPFRAKFASPGRRRVSVQRFRRNRCDV